MSKAGTVAGRIIAHDRALSCLNGYAWWSVLIRVETPRTKRGSPEYIRVNFSAPCTDIPEWLDAKSSVQKFKLIRDKKRDEVLEQFLPCVARPSSGDIPESCRIPMWLFVPGAEHETLPFGKVIASYRFEKLPLRDFIV
jgi:hypothetical protein